MSRTVQEFTISKGSCGLMSQVDLGLARERGDLCPGLGRGRWAGKG